MQSSDNSISVPPFYRFGHKGLETEPRQCLKVSPEDWYRRKTIP